MHLCRFRCELAGSKLTDELPRTEKANVVNFASAPIEMVNQPEDQHEIQEQLREKLREMRAMGLPLPADLVELEKRLDDDFYAAGT